jgi:adenylate cyclase
MIRIFHSFQGSTKTIEYPKAQVVIGRTRDGISADLDLTPDRQVSRAHARVWQESDGYWIEDLGSASGTQVSGEEIKGLGKRRLRGDDTLRLGLTTLIVEIPGEPHPHLSSVSPQELASTDLSSGNRVEIGKSIGADASAFSRENEITKDLAQRLALLYELPLKFSQEPRLEPLLQMIVERLVAVTPGAKRGTLLVCDRETNNLLLKAHLPHGEPAISMTLAKKAIDNREGFIWQRDTGTRTSQVGDSCLSGMYAPLLWMGQALGVVCVDSGSSLHCFDEEDLRLLLAVARYAGMALANHRLQDDLLQNAELLARLLTNFSPKIQENLLKRAHAGKLSLGGEKSEVTILCSDIRGFTKLTATMDATDVVEMLNEYFAALVSVIFENDGTVDKFVGDAILAVFGSPEPDPNQHEKAMRAALGMRAAVEKLNVTRAARGVPTCNIGIGLNCGEVFHGFIGAADRMEFTVVGDPVNMTSRYCDGAQGGEILMGPDMHQHVWRLVLTESVSIPTKHGGNLPVHRVKGVK